MQFQKLINRYQEFSQRPLRLPALIGIILALAGAITLGSLAVFWGSDTHRYIVDVQRASDNRYDDPDFPLIMPPGAAQTPTERLQPEQFLQVAEAIRSAAAEIDPPADFPPLTFGLDFVDRQLGSDNN